jgi:hypothetical protein
MSKVPPVALRVQPVAEEPRKEPSVISPRKARVELASPRTANPSTSGGPSGVVGSPRKSGSARSSPNVSPNSSPRSKIGSFIKSIVGGGSSINNSTEAAAPPATSEPKSRPKSAFVGAVRRKSPLRKSDAAQQGESGTGDMYIVKKDEASVFPGFKISTMANRSGLGSSRKSIRDVFQDSPAVGPEDDSSAPPPPLPMLPDEVEPVPELSELDTLKMLAPFCCGPHSFVQQNAALGSLWVTPSVCATPAGKQRRVDAEHGGKLAD